ncbi:MAG: UvrD-helicase domain-containing protein [Gammaproteobacteria bacterium]|nr:MAG: UvrD-helicase domain-containing protein [Gammaproteobacteria bacterium]
MSIPPLTVVPAGAGSGKTHHIQECLAEWISVGEVAPERIVAVTFTEAAAAELRERVRARLLAAGRVEDALRLDQAFISTIHGFGLRLLTEYAFDAGLSPSHRLLDEDEETMLVRLALARTGKADVLSADLKGFGYTFDWSSRKGAEAVMRDDVLRVVNVLRAIGWTRERRDLVAEAEAWIRARYGQPGDGEAVAEILHGAVTRLLAAFPQDLAPEHAKSAAGRKDLHRDHRNLNRAAEGNALASDWRLWQALRNLRQSKKSASLPDDYDALADDVIGAAGAIVRHPGPLEHAIVHIRVLMESGEDVIVHYGDDKRETGLVDYTDMVALAHDLLERYPQVLEALAARVDCLVIDEFQDTNPIQFALLWKLRQAGVPALVVGDLKQAIMGFQGADARLFEALGDQHPDAVNALEANWRSQPPLMDFINAVSSGLFGDNYDMLEAKAEESALHPLEVVVFAKRAKHEARAWYTGRRLAVLLADPEQRVIDKRSGKQRALEGRDIAVLCPTNKIAATYADVLRRHGLKVRLQEDGWFTSRIVQIAWHALCYVANPADRHAALYLAVTELGSLDLEPGLAQLLDNGSVEEPMLAALERLAEEVPDRSVDTLVAATIEALGLYDVVACWPDGAQARANLLKLQAEARTFLSAEREALARGGYYGTGLPTFLAWLAARIERAGQDAKDKGDRQPAPRVHDEDAVEVVTWHSAKGREWPVVAVCGLDNGVGAKLPDLAVEYEDFGDLDRLLENANIAYSPDFAAPEAGERFRVSLQTQAESDARRPLYVALTRAREKLILEWPSYLGAGKRKTTTYWEILEEATDAGVEEGALRVGDTAFPCLVHAGGADVPEDAGAADVVGTLPVIGRRAIRVGDVPRNLTPDSVAPSELGGEAPADAPSELVVEAYGDGLVVDLAMVGTELGTFLHRCFEVLGARPDLSHKLSDATGIALDALVVEAIGKGVAEFEAWVRDRFGPSSVARELPFSATRSDGALVSGVIDLLVDTDDGYWIIDHKSDVVDDSRAPFASYWPQLAAYVDAISSVNGGRPVLGVGINWIRRGEVVLSPASGWATRGGR